MNRAHLKGLKRYPVALLPLLLLAACSGGDKQKTNNNAEIHPVRTMTVQPENMLRTINAVGTVRYRRETPLGFTTAGKVATVRFNEGDYVKRGALLAALDGTPTSGDVSVASAELERARSDFERVRSLYADGWVTKARFESSEASVKVAEARVRQAGFASGTSRLYAPSSGTVLSRLVQPGQVVGAGTAALVLGEDSGGFVFRVPVIDRDASKLNKGMAATITIESLGPEPVSATISEIEGRANEATGAFTIVFQLASRGKLRSGQIGSASISLPAGDSGSLQIPTSAIFNIRTGEGLVYVVDPKTKRVETRSVVIERLTDNSVIVTGGIKTGDVVVTSGGEKLRSGSRVRIVGSAG